MADSTNVPGLNTGDEIRFIQEIEGTSYEIVVTKRFFDKHSGADPKSEGSRNFVVRIAEEKVKAGQTSPVTIDLGDEPAES